MLRQAVMGAAATFLGITRPWALRQLFIHWHLCRQIPEEAYHGVFGRARQASTLMATAGNRCWVPGGRRNGASI